MAFFCARKNTQKTKPTNNLAVESLEARQLLACDTVPTLEIAKAEYVVGDVDCDGVFGTSDIVKVFLAGKFNGSAAYHEGDFNGDGRFTSEDFDAAFANFSKSDPAAAPGTQAGLPRVTGAISTSNTTVVIAFSEPMSSSVIDAARYSIVQANVNGEAGALRVRSAKFVNNADRTRVELTTFAQSELTYAITAVGVSDVGGSPLASVQVTAGGTKVDPTTAEFAGSPPDTGGEIVPQEPDGDATLVDTDGDGLSDNEEQSGWLVTVTLSNGERIQREVTSNPLIQDSDGDGFSDAVEKARRIDPRDRDTDDDLLDDFFEVNHLSSSPANQDTDGDGIGDNSEFNFYKTSPTLTDTDGDQIPDGKEILLSNRNPLVADLPRPTLSIGEAKLQIDVRFSASTSRQTRDLDSKSVTATLETSEENEHSSTESQTHQAFAKASFSYSVEKKTGGTLGLNGSAKDETTTTKSGGGEAGYTGTYTAAHTERSTNSSRQAYEDSLTTEAEITDGESIDREVAGASMQVAVSLANASDIAFTLKNLQLTALMQDPQDPASLTPIATLVPEVELPDGISLGPTGFSPDKGPFIFKSSSVFPNLVESLMKNPTGLIYRFSNFDIVDELDRNFAFTSQDIVDRTGSLVIDNGAFDADGDGRGDLTEINRVALGSGRRVDLNENGKIDEDEARIVFDNDGKHVGITLRESLEALGLKRYIEPISDETDPNKLIEKEVDKTRSFPALAAGLTTDELSKIVRKSTDLTVEQQENSYSVTFSNDGVERIYRIRDTISRDPRLGETIGTEIAKTWEVLGPTGIDTTKSVSEFVLNTNEPLTLAYVQDLDEDRLPDMVEALNRSSDRFVDSDNKSLLFSIQSPNVTVLEQWIRDLNGDSTVEPSVEAKIPADLRNAFRHRSFKLNDDANPLNLTVPENDSLRNELHARPSSWVVVENSQPIGDALAVAQNDFATKEDVDALVANLDDKALTELLKVEFAENNRPLSTDAAISVTTTGSGWTISDRQETTVIRLETPDGADTPQLVVYENAEDGAATKLFVMAPSDINKLDAKALPNSITEVLKDELTAADDTTLHVVKKGEAWRITNQSQAFVVSFFESKPADLTYTYAPTPFALTPDEESGPITNNDRLRANVTFAPIEFPATDIQPKSFSLAFLDEDGDGDFEINNQNVAENGFLASFDFDESGNITVAQLTAASGDKTIDILVGGDVPIEFMSIADAEFRRVSAANWTKEAAQPTTEIGQLQVAFAERRYLIQNEVGRLDVYDRSGDGIDNDGDTLIDEMDEFRMDALDDRFEALIGWQVEITGKGSKRVFSSPTQFDTDGDGLSDAEEAPSSLVRDENGLILSSREYIRPAKPSDDWLAAIESGKDENGNFRSIPQSNSGLAIYTGEKEETFTFTVKNSGTVGEDEIAIQCSQGIGDAATACDEIVLSGLPAEADADEPDAYDGEFISVKDGLRIRFVVGTENAKRVLVEGNSFEVKALQSQRNGTIGQAVKVERPEGDGPTNGTAIATSNAGDGYTGEFNDVFTFEAGEPIAGQSPDGKIPLPSIACTRISGVSCGTIVAQLDYTANLPLSFADGVTLAFDDGTFTIGDQFRVEVTKEFITDPASKDTDGDGVSDFDEIRGYCVVIRNSPSDAPNDAQCSGVDSKGKPVSGQIFRKTDPTNPDTDGDTASDGVERRLGGDPTDPSDRDKFSDDDGDGLVNIVEKEGWKVTTRGVEGAADFGSNTPVNVKTELTVPDEYKGTMVPSTEGSTTTNLSTSEDKITYKIVSWTNAPWREKDATEVVHIATVSYESTNNGSGLFNVVVTYSTNPTNQMNEDGHATSNVSTSFTVDGTDPGDIKLKFENTSTIVVLTDAQRMALTNEKRDEIDANNKAELEKLPRLIPEETFVLEVEGPPPRFCDSACVDTAAITTGQPITSDPNNPDTDDDGILDGREHLFRTNPRNKDTDSDGLTDREEILGLEVRDLGIIPPFEATETADGPRSVGLNPLDADTDNDRIKDGDEVNGSWISRVAGKDPKRVFSDPTDPDADLDRLVDGDERRAGTDPNNSNSDGDGRDDYVEATTGQNALQEDFRVTVVLRTLEIWSDGDRDGGNDDHDPHKGDFRVDFGVKKPSNSTVTGLSNNVDFVHRWSDGRIEIGAGCGTCDGNDVRDLKFPGEIHRFENKAITFSMTPGQRFSIEGTLIEEDGFEGDEGGQDTPKIEFGGLLGSQITAKGSERLGVFHGSELVGKSIETYSVDFKNGVGTGASFLRGELSFLIIVDPLGSGSLVGNGGLGGGTGNPG